MPRRIDIRTLKKFARQNELIIIGRSSQKGSIKVVIKSCKHQKTLRTDRVRSGKFVCEPCKEQRFRDEAVAAGFQLLGSTENPNYRIYRCLTCDADSSLVISHVRKKSVICQSCLDTKLETEASNQGLEVTEKLNDNRYRLYKFRSCKHEQVIAVANVRSGAFECKTCEKIKHESEATEAGLHLIGPSLKKGYRIYRFVECSHEQEIQLTNVRRKVFHCITCHDTKLIEEARSKNLTLITKSVQRDRNLYRFDQCNHTQLLPASAVRANRFRCGTCLEETFQNDATNVGLELVGEGKTSAYRTYRFKDCRHVQQIRWDSVRLNTFLCEQCNETSRTQPCVIYLLKLKYENFSWLKLGYTKSLELRIQKFSLPPNTKIFEVNKVIFSTGALAHGYEAALHRKYSLFKIDPVRMRQYHQKSGFNECYPVELEPELSNELDIVQSNLR